MDDTNTLTETEELLLMAAALHGLGPDTSLGFANTSRVVNQVLVWHGLSAEAVRRGWRAHDCDALHKEVYDTLIRMTHQECREGSCERPGPALFEGGGNWGVPGDPSRPACWPHYNSCRLTEEGERLAQALLHNHPEYQAAKPAK